MPVKPRQSINMVFAVNLAEAMVRRNIGSQEQLAKLSGLSQRTISNYLNPERRSHGKSGKEPSAKLSEVEQIARALDMETWDMLRPIQGRERAFYEQIEEAYRKLRGDDPEVD